MELVLLFFMYVAGSQDVRITELEQQNALQNKWIIDLENWNDEQEDKLTKQELFDYSLAGEIAAEHASNERTDRLQDLVAIEQRKIIDQILRELANEEN